MFLVVNVRGAALLWKDTLEGKNPVEEINDCGNLAPNGFDKGDDMCNEKDGDKVDALLNGVA